MVVRLAATPDAPREARAAVTASLDRDARSVAASLATSEIVTNAILHGHLDAHDTIELRVTDDGARLHVEVLNTAAASFSVGDVSDQRDGDVGRFGGWGLGIVATVSSRWGVREERGRTLVWFEVT